MIPIMIDISPLVSSLNFSEEDVKGLSRTILNRLSARYMMLWERNVDSELGSTRAFYKAGMKWYYENDYTVVFELEGKGMAKLGLMIERGASAFDIKEGFKTSPKAKNPGQPNWYLTVPFRHATSTAIAESTVFSAIMPKLVEKMVKKEGKITKNNIPKEFDFLGKREEITGSDLAVDVSEKYTHKNPIHEGLMKSDTGGYVTMRRVSGNSAKNSWIHKGFQKKGFMALSMEQMSSEIPTITANARDEFLDIKFGE